MEWWVYFLVFLAIGFAVFTIYFSFIYSNKIKRQNLALDRKKRPHKIIKNPEDIKLFLNFKIADLNKITPDPDYQQAGVFGFYIDKKIRYEDGFYPIYLAKSETDIWEDIQTIKAELLDHQEQFDEVYQYLEKNNYGVDKIHFFIIEDYNIANFDYWTEVLETDKHGFNQIQNFK